MTRSDISFRLRFSSGTSGTNEQDGQWYRTYGLDAENGLVEYGLVEKGQMSGNDVKIAEMVRDGVNVDGYDLSERKARGCQPKVDGRRESQTQ